jgi:FkbM family methyltransferase
LPSLNLPYLTNLYRQFGGRGLHDAVVANERGTLGCDDVVSFQLPSPYKDKVLLRPATNDLFTFEEVMLIQVYSHVLQCLRDARSVIDLGANIGLASLYFLHHYQNCRVLAVEPEGMNFRLLANNLAPYVATGRAHALRAAFWKDDVPVVFEPGARPEDVNKGSVRSRSEFTNLEPDTAVDGLGILSIIKRSGFSTVDLMKIDIEGGEEHIFSGELSWLKRVRCIAVEFHNQTRTLSDFDAIANAHGFTVSEPNPHTVIAMRSH